MNDLSPMKTWKKIAVRAVFGRIGFAVGAAAIVGAAIWYSGRSTPPPSWNATALKANFVWGRSDPTL
jgi:hypothetical protein